MASKKENNKNKKIAPVQLFEKFGEFDSVEELNEAAAGQLEEGDLDALRELAEENGIEKEDVQDYIDGYTDVMAMPITAAMGRLKVEMEALKDSAQIRAMCKFYSEFAISAATEDEEVARGIMKKGARIKGIYDAIYKYASKHKEGGCFSGSTTDRQDMELVKTYYKGGDVNALFKKWFAGEAVK